MTPRFNEYEGREWLAKVEKRDNNPLYVDFYKQRAFLETLSLQCSRTVEELEKLCLQGRFEEGEVALKRLEEDFMRMKKFYIREKKETQNSGEVEKKK